MSPRLFALLVITFVVVIALIAMRINPFSALKKLFIGGLTDKICPKCKYKNNYLTTTGLCQECPSTELEERKKNTHN